MAGTHHQSRSRSQARRHYAPAKYAAAAAAVQTDSRDAWQGRAWQTMHRQQVADGVEVGDLWLPGCRAAPRDPTLGYNYFI